MKRLLYTLLTPIFLSLLLLPNISYAATSNDVVCESESGRILDPNNCPPTEETSPITPANGRNPINSRNPATFITGDDMPTQPTVIPGRGTIPTTNRNPIITPQPTGLPQPRPTVHLLETSVSSETEFKGYISGLIKILFFVGAVAAIIAIIFGGLQYMVSKTIDGVSGGKSKILHAVGGLLILLGVWIILNRVNPDLVSANINIDVVVEEVIGINI